MKYSIIIIIASLFSCNSSVNNSMKENTSPVNLDSIRFANEEIQLIRATVFDDHRVLITIKNNTINDYYVECFNQRKHKIPMIKAVTKAHDMSTKSVHLAYFPGGLDTVILLKSKEQKEFLIGNNIRTNEIDTVYADTYYKPVSQGKNQKLIMHLAIKGDFIHRFYNPGYLDAIRADSLMREIAEKKKGNKK